MTNMIYWDSRVRKEDYDKLCARLKKVLNKEPVKNVEFWKGDVPIDYVNGNGDYQVTIATTSCPEI